MSLINSKLAIIGSGDLGRQVKDAAIEVGYEFVGFFDDFANPKKPDISKLFEANSFECLFIAIGYKHMLQRKLLFEKFTNVIPFANIIHPSAIIGKKVTLGDGIIIYMGVIIDNGVTIGDNVLINAGGCIAHDTEIGAHCFLSPRVSLAGFIRIEECTILGVNCIIIDNISVASNTQLGGGTVVIASIEEKGYLHVGNPSRKVRSILAE